MDGRAPQDGKDRAMQSVAREIEAGWRTRNWENVRPAHVSSERSGIGAKRTEKGWAGAEQRAGVTKQVWALSGKSAAHAPLTGSIRRRIVCGGSKRIGMPRGRTARPLLSVLKSKISKSTRVTDRLPFPLEFRNHNAVLENHSGTATRPRKFLMIYLAV